MPDRLAFGEPGDPDSHGAYLSAWHLWRAIRRDAQLTNAELDARFRVLAERLGYPGVGLWDVAQ